MGHDYLGNPVSCTHGATLHAIDEFIQGYLAYESRAEDINSIHGGPAEDEGGYPAPCVPDSCRMIIIGVF
jgi:hypothetical protein